jgi:hypothetical protein
MYFAGMLLPHGVAQHAGASLCGAFARRDIHRKRTQEASAKIEFDVRDGSVLSSMYAPILLLAFVRVTFA